VRQPRLPGNRRLDDGDDQPALPLGRAAGNRRGRGRAGPRRSNGRRARRRRRRHGRRPGAGQHRQLAQPRGHRRRRPAGRSRRPAARAHPPRPAAPRGTGRRREHLGGHVVPGRPGRIPRGGGPGLPARRHPRPLTGPAHRAADPPPPTSATTIGRPQGTMHTPTTGHETPNLLEMRSITKEFPGVKALADVNLKVRAGEIHAICGEHGAGKSTLMKVLSGVYPHGSYTGEVYFQGAVQSFRGINASEQAGIVIIHQELALIPELSIMENIFLGNEPTRFGIIDWATARVSAMELLARVGLSDSPDTPIKEIGVGKQQLVEIAKALNKSVKLLILDEPTAALNESDSQHLLDLILGLKGRGITSIIISHKLNEIEQIADEITIIRDGKSIETLNVKADGVDEDRIIRGMVGRTLESRFPDHEPKIGEVLFEV